MKYIEKDGYNICNEGTVIINHEKHYVKGGLVYCDSSLNKRSWNTTEERAVCEICRSQIMAGMKQLELF